MQLLSWWRLLGPSHRFINPLILAWSSCLLEWHAAWAAAHQHCGSLTDWWDSGAPFSSRGLWLRQLWQHEWRPVPRRPDHWSDWAPAAGCAGFALLLYLQIGCCAAAGWTRHILRVNEALVWEMERGQYRKVLTLDCIQLISRFLQFGCKPATACVLVDSLLLSVAWNAPKSVSLTRRAQIDLLLLFCLHNNFTAGSSVRGIRWFIWKLSSAQSVIRC